MSLLTELQTDPAALGYATPLAAGNDEVVASLLNNRQFTVPGTRIITARGILSDYPGGPSAAAALLDKLNTAAPNVSALKWAWMFITGDGLDIGSLATQGMLDTLATNGVITTTEATNLKALGMTSKSRSEILFGGQTQPDEVARTVRAANGTSLL
jgi:hypothetical protein